MKEVKCQYCQRKCRPDTSQGIKYWRCDYHGSTVVKYLVANEPEIWHTTILQCRHRETTYHVSFFFDNPNYLYKFRIDKIKVHRYVSSAEPIVTLDFHPDNITPENVSNKLPTLLLFS